MMLQTARTTTGIPSLDQLLEGGFPKGRSFLVTGEPGTGKSIFALQFVVDGLKRGERCIFVTADEEPGDVIEQAESHQHPSDGTSNATLKTKSSQF